MTDLLTYIKNQIFTNLSPSKFENLAIALFKYQANHCSVYKEYIKLMGVNVESVEKFSQIPFIPVEFFKDFKITSGDFVPEIVFSSSSTSGLIPSRHHIKDLGLYEKSFTNAFNHFYGNPSDYAILALLPSYLERSGSSLVYMMNSLISFGQKESGFFLYDYEKLHSVIEQCKKQKQKIILLGVSFALWDLSTQFSIDLSGHIVIETGGMKGRKKELTRAELHNRLKSGFNLTSVHSEYGMTELLSQAYSNGNGIFHTPPWMKVLIRDNLDPQVLLEAGKSGVINVIDLANIYSCSFIATQDLGVLHNDNSFEVLGRNDLSDIRGCSLMVI